MSDSLRCHGLQHARLPCLSPTLRTCSNSCPRCHCRSCHPTISSSVIPFSSGLQSFPASEYFTMSQLFTSGGQYIGVSASASILPMSIQGWFPLGLIGWVSLKSKGPSRVFCRTTVQKHQSLVLSFLYDPTLTSYMITGKTIVLTILTFVSKVMSLLLHMLSRFVIAFLPRSKCLLILWL